MNNHSSRECHEAPEEFQAFCKLSTHMTITFRSLAFFAALPRSLRWVSVERPIQSQILYSTIVHDSERAPITIIRFRKR